MNTSNLKKSLISLIFLQIIIVGFLSWLIISPQKQALTFIPASIQSAISHRKSRGMHSALIGQEILVERSYQYRKEAAKKGSVQGLIVNHHLLAGDLIAETFAYAENQSVRDIVLIAPNHFHQGKGEFIASEYDWRTPNGILEADHVLIDSISSLSEDEDAIKGEHGLSNLIPFVKRSFPKANIIPIMVRDDVSDEMIDRFSLELASILPKDTLIIGSFDFSHDASPQSADYHDQMAHGVVYHGDIDSVSKLDIDSRPGLRLLMRLMEDQKARFHRLAMTNSSIYTKNPYQDDVTSYLTGYYSKDPSSEATAANLLFFGDMMLDRYVRSQIQKHGNDYPFEKLGRFLWGSDHIVSNLEGTITDNSSIYITGEEEALQFTFDPSVVDTFKQYGFDTFSLANNHSLDYGQLGLDETRERLESEGFSTFGDYHNQESIQKVINIRGKSISLIGFHQFGRQNFEKVLEAVRQSSELGDFVIVMPHWGAEYQLAADKNQQEFAYQFIDAGADLVIGSGPHTVQPMELYHGKLIVYSLGNFVFDQLFSEDVQMGLALGVSIRDNNLLVYPFPFHISNNLQVEIYSPEEASEFYQEYAIRSKLMADLQEQLKGGLIQIVY